MDQTRETCPEALPDIPSPLDPTDPTIVDNGVVRVFIWDGDSWDQYGADIHGEQSLEYNGFSCSLSGDGTTVAIGSYGWNYAGRARVYDFIVPTASPTASPTANPTANPTASPTASPTANPTANPTTSPTASPTPVADVYLNVTVVETPSGNIFAIDGIRRPILRFERGKSYAFVSSVPGLFLVHPLVVGSSRLVVVDDATPSRLRYACSLHEGMGNMIVVGTEVKESSGSCSRPFSGRSWC